MHRSIWSSTRVDSCNVNDMPGEAIDENDDYGELELFADDSTAYEIGSTIDEATAKMQVTANNLYQYACKNSLTIHPGKCKLLIISRESFVGPLNTIKINNE